MTKAETYLLACGESLDRADLMKDLLDETYVMVKPLLFHWMLVHGEWDDHSGYFDRWCYATRELAMDALQNFPECPPSGYEPAGWTDIHGQRDAALMAILRRNIWSNET